MSFRPSASFNTAQFTKMPGAADIVTRFAADVSELTRGTVLQLGRVYEDASDVGFELLCERTTRSVRMVLRETQKDDEGSTLCWKFSSDERDTRRLKIHPIAVTVFND